VVIKIKISYYDEYHILYNICNRFKKGNQKSIYFEYLYFRKFHFSFLVIATARTELWYQCLVISLFPFNAFSNC